MTTQDLIEIKNETWLNSVHLKQTSHMRPVNQIESKTHTQASLYFCLYGDVQWNNTLPWPLNPNLTPFLNSTLKPCVNPQRVALWCKFNDAILYQMWSTFFRWPHIYQILFPHPQAFPKGHRSWNISISPFLAWPWHIGKERQRSQCREHPCTPFFLFFPVCLPKTQIIQ